MKHINYVAERDELIITLKETETPMIVTLRNNVMLEFDDMGLSAIIMPHFFQMIGRPPIIGADFQYEGAEFIDQTMTIIIAMNGQRINIKCDLSELEN